MTRLVCAVVVLLGTMRPAAAQDADLEVLKARLLELEKQQEQLLRKLNQVAPSADAQSGSDAGSPKPAEAPQKPAQPAEKKETKKLSENPIFDGRTFKNAGKK